MDAKQLPAKKIVAVRCSKCGVDCTFRHWMCDRREGTWCSHCFGKTACGKGSHGEGCPTQVFEDAESDREPDEDSDHCEHDIAPRSACQECRENE